jgi:hypothetical protein
MKGSGLRWPTDNFKPSSSTPVLDASLLFFVNLFVEI